MACSSRGKQLISASRRSEGSMVGKPSAARDLSDDRFFSSMRFRFASSSCQRFSSRSRRFRSSACLSSSSFQGPASAALTTWMLSPRIDFVSTRPRSKRSSTSHREGSLGFSLRAMPRLPLRWGAFSKPLIRTAWPERKSKVGPFFRFSPPSSVKSISTAFFAPSETDQRPVRMSCIRPTFLATNMCTFTESSLKSKRWPWERSRCALLHCPNFRCATPRTW
mmetsp:Transcript_33407/g.71000  ORF Transcript_33407/g.71000 Transcript_33407/m.71000 type:complete len:222 (-) Transcript_33407:9-674(-)